MKTMTKQFFWVTTLILGMFLASCSQAPIPSDTLEVQAEVAKVSIAVTYDYVAERNEKEATFNQNGQYEKPELSLGGFPVYITPVDKEGNIIGETTQYETKASADPLESLNLELPLGYYYIDSPLPEKTQGGDSINWAKTSKETLVLVDGQSDIHLVNLLRTCSSVIKGTHTVADYLALLRDTNTVYQIYQPCEPLTFSLYIPEDNIAWPYYDDPTPFTNVGNGLCTNSENPAIVRDSTDKPIIAYQCLDGNLNGMPKHSIYVKRWNGSAWVNYGASARINTTTTVDARTPSLAVTTTGNPVIAWVETDAGNTVSRIYIKEWNGSAWILKGSAITPPNDPSQPVPGNYLADELQLVLSSNNNPFVAWHNGGFDNVFVYGWNGSSWKDYQGTSHPHAINISLALTSNNLPVLATESDNVTVQRWNNTTQNWVTFVDAISGESALDIDIPSSTQGVSLALDRNNNPVVAWNEPFGAVPGLYVKRWTGSSWSVVTNTSNSQARPVAQALCWGGCANPSISIDSSNRPVLAYIDNGSVFVKRYDTVRTGRNQWIQFGTGLNRNVGLASSTDMVLKTNGLPIVTWQETAPVSPWTTNVLVSQR